MLNYGGQQKWYGSPHSPGIEGVASGNPRSQYWFTPANGQAFYCTYDDSSSVDDKIRWADSLGIGGFMIYSLDKDMLTGKSTHASRLPTHAKAVQTLRSLH
jgi:GH18 family chitinase